MKTKTVFCLALSFTLSLSSFAQQDSTERKLPSLQVSLAYQSNSVYLGRKDSLKLPYLIPGIRYTASSGFYAETSAFLLTNENRLDALSLDAGYEFGKGNFFGGLAADAYIFSPQSVNVRAEASTSLNAYAGCSLPFLEPGVNASLVYGNGSFDYLAGASLQHNFTSRNEVFSFTPALYLNAGTQNYYNEYYRQRKYNSGSGKGRGKGKGASGSTAVVNAEASASSAFKVLDYELEGKFEYTVKHFSFSFNPQYAIPQNPSAITITTKTAAGATTTQTFTETISNSFFWTFGVNYNFNLKKHA
jgi:hypothetical protein